MVVHELTKQGNRFSFPPLITNYKSRTKNYVKGHQGNSIRKIKNIGNSIRLMICFLPTIILSSVQFSSVAQSCLTLCDPVDCSMPGFPVPQHLPELVQTHVHWVGDAIQPSHPLSSPSPSAFNFYQHQGLFQWVSSSHQVAKVLELQLQHQFFQYIFRTDFL